jgi:hypothetical protein
MDATMMNKFAQKTASLTSGDLVEGNGTNEVNPTTIPSAVVSKTQKECQSSGRITGGVITAHTAGGADGTIDISEMTGIIKTTNAVDATTTTFTMTAKTSIALTDNALNYLYYDYTTATVAATTDRTAIHEYDQFTVGRVYRQGTDVDIVSSGTNIYNFYRRIHNRLVKKYGFDHASGATVASTGTRNLTTTDGVWYIGNTEITTSAKDTSASDKFTYYYLSGAATWTAVANSTQIDNTQYNLTGSPYGLATLSNNKYGVHWVFICPEGDVYVVYGQGDYSLADAQNAVTPSTLPDYVVKNTRLAAKIIVAKSSDTLTVTSAYVQGFPASSAPNHNDLGGLQGGASNEYYHLTSNQSNVFDSVPTATLSGVTVYKGGVANGGFENQPTFVANTTANNWIDGTAAGSATVDQYGWYLYTTGGSLEAAFSSTESYRGKGSLKIIFNTGGAGSVNCAPTYLNIDQATNKYLIPLKASTKYRASCRMKISSVTTAGTGVSLYVGQYAGLTYSTGGGPAYANAVQDWTEYVYEFTTGGTITGGTVGMLGVATNLTSYWDDIKLEEVVEDATSVVSAVHPHVVFQGVTTTDNVDQSQLVIDTSEKIGDNANVDYWIAESFTPTKSKLAGIVLSKETTDGTPTGNLVFDIRTDNSGSPSSVIVASKSFTLAEWNAYSNGEVTISVPCLLTPGALYWVVGHDSVDNEATGVGYKVFAVASGAYPGGTTKYSTNQGGAWTPYGHQLYFKTHYAKPSEQATVILNGVKTELKSGNSDGILGGAIIDLDKGKYHYDSGSLISSANTRIWSNTVYSATAGGQSTIGGNIDYIFLNGWAHDNLVGMYDATVAGSVVIKVNTVAPINHLKIRESSGSDGTLNIQISSDNVNYTTIRTFATPTVDALAIIDTDLVNGCSTFYLKFTCTVALAIVQLGFEADLDASQIPVGLVYPLAVQQFESNVVLPSVATRAYYRQSKFQNTQGVVMPAIEFTDGSAVYIGHVFTPIDNGAETNPAIDVLSTSTNWQQTGTGANDSTTGYILNDGEYMTLSSTASSIKVVYKVGGGTTSFANITKNRFYISSDGVANDATKDPSLECGVQYQIPNQGIVETVGDLQREVEKVKHIDGEWTDYTPYLVWGTATPEGSVSTLGSYKIVGKTCYFTLNYSATDGNGATSLSLSLPCYATGPTSVTVAAVQKVDTTWSNPISYIASGTAKVQFLGFSAATDTKAIAVLVSGFYEIE